MRFELRGTEGKILCVLTNPFSDSHGLSYTTFTTSDIDVSDTEASVTIENTGPRAGSEVLRLYISHGGKSRFIRPVRTLGGFKKVFLQPGETKRVALPIDRYSTSVWDEGKSAWCVEAGEYVASVAAGEGTTTLEGRFSVGEDTFWTGL